MTSVEIVIRKGPPIEISKISKSDAEYGRIPRRVAMGEPQRNARFTMDAGPDNHSCCLGVMQKD